MAKELPIYESSVPIKTGGQTPSALSGLGSAIHASESLGAIGAEVASTAANQRASIQALRDAQNPNGYEPVPAFTKADQHYVQTYNQQSLNTLSHIGQQDLERQFHVYAQNPTPEGLLEYEKFGKETIENMSRLGTDSNRYEVQRSLESYADSRFHALANSVDAKNRQVIASNFNTAYNQALQNQHDYGAQGMWSQLNEETDSALRSNDAALQAGSILPEEHAQRKKSIDLTKRISQQIYGLNQAEKSGNGDKYLKNFVENPGDLSPSDAETVGASLYKSLNTQRALRSGQDNLDYMQAKLQLMTEGNPTPSQLDEWKQSLSSKNFLDIQMDIARMNAEENRKLQLVQTMSQDFGNVAEMANYTDGQFKDVFGYISDIQEKQYQDNTGQPQPYPLIAQASIAQQIKRENPVLANSLSQAINYGNPDQATEAAEALRMLAANNPVAVQGLSPQTKMVSELFNLHAKDQTKTKEEALKQAREEVYNVDESTRVDRVNRLKEYRNNNQQYKPTYSNSLKIIKENLSEKGAVWGHKDTVMPAGIVTEFDRLWSNYAAIGADPEVAKKAALDELSRIYTPTSVNGRSEIMFMSPESVLPNAGNYIQNDKVLALNEFIQRNQQKSQNGEFVLNHVEWAKPPSLSDNVVATPFVKGDLKVKVDGEEKKVFVDSDAITELSGTGQPSWIFYYMDDYGNKVPLMDADRPSAVARWVPDKRRLRSTIQGRNKELLKAAKLKRAGNVGVTIEDSLDEVLNDGE